jgi:hypothetical protein
MDVVSEELARKAPIDVLDELRGKAEAVRQCGYNPSYTVRTRVVGYGWHGMLCCGTTAELGGGPSRSDREAAALEGTPASVVALYSFLCPVVYTPVQYYQKLYSPLYPSDRCARRTPSAFPQPPLQRRGGVGRRLAQPSSMSTRWAPIDRTAL